jgi:hypothetical protein
MPKLFKRDYTPDELRRLTSTLDQLAGVRLYELSDGKARGLRAAEVWTGSGLRFTIWLDRAMDIGPAEFRGTPLAWLNPSLGTSGQFEPQGYGWLRTYGGGLVTTCGLTHFGQPDQEGGEAFGLHGRIAHIPAHNVRVFTEWQGDDYVLTVEGQVRQSVLFGENQLLTRRITTRLGATSFQMEDHVVNDGFRPSPHMLLYHCNFGFPVISPQTELAVTPTSGTVDARDEVAQRGMGTYTRFQAPDPDNTGQVFFHNPTPDANGQVTARLHNPDLGFDAFVRYRAAELPALSQWKNLGPGEYVCAIEPCTNHEAPRVDLHQRQELRSLQPGESVDYWVEIGVLPEQA